MLTADELDAHEVTFARCLTSMLLQSLQVSAQGKLVVFASYSKLNVLPDTQPLECQLQSSLQTCNQMTLLSTLFGKPTSLRYGVPPQEHLVLFEDRW